MAKMILIVDDSATVLMSLKTYLEAVGIIIETANDGVKALAKLKDGLKPDLIITDINMPNMNGIELIQNVKSLPGFRFMPILVMTTESQQAKRDEAKKAGATGWVVKPTAPTALLQIIKQVLPGA
jgi:two-component system chemotaxis response regulator CheY